MKAHVERVGGKGKRIGTAASTSAGEPNTSTRSILIRATTRRPQRMGRQHLA
jgi:hypothetical protein